MTGGTVSGISLDTDLPAILLDTDDTELSNTSIMVYIQLKPQDQAQ